MAAARELRNCQAKLKIAQSFSRQLILQHEQDRMQISRELHDEISQLLAGINFQLSALGRLADKGNRTLAKTLSEAQTVITQSIEKVHHYATELRPRVLDVLGLISALQSYSEEFERNSKIKVTFNAPQVEFPHDEKRDTILFRIAKEAFSNVAKHAKATNIWLTLSQKGKSVCMQIRNDGISFNVDGYNPGVRDGRLGLIGMYERIAIVQGTLKITSNQNEGTIVFATAPIITKRNKAAPPV